MKQCQLVMSVEFKKDSDRFFIDCLLEFIQYKISDENHLTSTITNIHDSISVIKQQQNRTEQNRTEILFKLICTSS